MGWPVLLLLNGIVVWWALGLHLFIAPLLALPCLLYLIVRSGVRAPRSIVLWFLFLLWVLLSATQIDDSQRFAAFLYRNGWYVAGAIIFLYVGNVPKERLPSRRLIQWVAVFFGIIVIGGMVGTIVPNLSFTTPVEAVLPQSIKSNVFVYYNVHASTSGERAFAAIPVFRTKAPFPYQNQWGETYAVVLPFAMAAVALTRSRMWRKALIVLLIVSIVPLVVSLDRGAWISATVAVVYSAILLTIRNRPGRLGAIVIGGVLVGAILLASPLGDYVLTRINSGYGDKHRARLYATSVELAQASPILGYGAPVEFEEGPKAISAGTHGQFWTILVSQGYPGVLFFFGWFGWAFWRSFRQDRRAGAEAEEARFWANVTIVTALSQVPYYEWLPYGFIVVMIAAAIVWREAPDRVAHRLRRLYGPSVLALPPPGLSPPSVRHPASRSETPRPPDDRTSNPGDLVRIWDTRA